MDESIVQLTVYFEAPFWVGVFERIEGGRLSAAKVTFGAEPKDYEIWSFILKTYGQLRFSPSVDAVVRNEAVSPKRLQREAHRQTACRGIGTRSQQALQMQREENKRERKTVSREMRQAEAERRFSQRQQKRKEMHRGR